PAVRQAADDLDLGDAQVAGQLQGHRPRVLAQRRADAPVQPVRRRRAHACLASWVPLPGPSFPGIVAGRPPGKNAVARNRTMSATPPRPCTPRGPPEPYHFFGRAAELALLDEALRGGDPSLVAFVGPGGQGKTAIVQHWLDGFREGLRRADGVFLWSFYRGKDADLCLRALLAYAEGR